MVKVGLRGPEEMVSQLPTQGAILDTCYKLAQPGCQVGTLEMSSSGKKNTRQCLSQATYSIDYGFSWVSKKNAEHTYKCSYKLLLQGM